VYHQLLPRADAVSGVLHSYFDGEADAVETLPLPAAGVCEDALPILLRGWVTSLSGARREPDGSVPAQPAARRDSPTGRSPWGRRRSAAPRASVALAVPAGRFDVNVWTVAEDGGATTTYAFEAAPPYRLVRRAKDDGEELVLLGSTRLPY
jgi:hypothetical protein